MTDTTPTAFAALGLADVLLHAVADLGFTEPTPVQAQTIPLALPRDDGWQDLMVSSQTGSGKTASFLLPVLHTLWSNRLARQAAENAEWEARVAEAAAAGTEPPKRPRRKDPTNPRNFKAASIKIPPDPQKGSSSGSPFHSTKSSNAAARFSFKGAFPTS